MIDREEENRAMRVEVQDQSSGSRARAVCTLGVGYRSVEVAKVVKPAECGGSVEESP